MLFLAIFLMLCEGVFELNVKKKKIKRHNNGQPLGVIINEVSLG